MSQSPGKFEQLDPDHEYLKNFGALGIMIGRGKSFSGRERNCLFFNLGNGRFADVSSVTGFDFIDDGRGIAITDWDGDGDLDLWLNNRTGPRVRFLKNALANRNQFLSVRLRGTVCNRDAIGARVELQLNGEQARTIIKTVRAGDGFLSQSSKLLHFGFKPDEKIKQLTIRWPGNTGIEAFSQLSPNKRYEFVQDSELDLLSAKTVKANVDEIALRKIRILPGDPELPKSSDQSRLFLTRRLPLPQIEYSDFENTRHVVSQTSSKRRLITLWASWCAPCMEELTEFAEHADRLASRNIEVVALSVDKLDNGETGHAAKSFLSGIPWPFTSGYASKSAIRSLTKRQHQVVYRERPLALPSSFLVDEAGQIAVIYQGRVSTDQVLKDADALRSTGAALAAVVFPFPGKTASRLFANNQLAVIQSLVEAGYIEDARTDLRHLIDATTAITATSQRERFQRDKKLAQLYLRLGQLEQDAQKLDAASGAFLEAARIDPRHPVARVSLATVYWRQADPQRAQSLLDEVLKLGPDDSQLLHLLAKTYENLGDNPRAISFYRRALKQNPADASLRTHLAIALQSTGAAQEAITEYRIVLREHPTKIDAANNLAWLLATHQDLQLRNADEALTLARMVCKVTGARQPSGLDTLAAALAASGDFENAVRIAKTAIELANRQNHKELAEKIEVRLAGYQNSKPFLED